MAKVHSAYLKKQNEFLCIRKLCAKSQSEEVSGSIITSKLQKKCNKIPKTADMFLTTVGHNMIQENLKNSMSQQQEPIDWPTVPFHTCNDY